MKLTKKILVGIIREEYATLVFEELLGTAIGFYDEKKRPKEI